MIILDSNGLNYLKRNIDENMVYYRDCYNPWIDRFIEGISKESLIQDNTLTISNEPSLDTENAIQLYENNKTLSTTLASSDHYWTTLAHTRHYNYMQIRWPVSEKSNATNIESRYFFSSTNQKSRARHGLTRLWWIAHLTYDDRNQNDPYYYTRLATRDQELYNLIMETKHVAQNKKALFAMLDTIMTVFELLDNNKIKKFNKRSFFRDTMQQINLIGSVTIWDMLSQSDAKQKLMDFATKYLNIREIEILT